MKADRILLQLKCALIRVKHCIRRQGGQRPSAGHAGGLVAHGHCLFMAAERGDVEASMTSL
jgi:hypothetical protein